MVRIELPYPPSINHYWRHVGPRVLISREGRAFRARVVQILGGLGLPTLCGPLAVCIEAHPPDNRRRDLDNIQKSLLDALQHGRLYADDSQIVDLRAIKFPTVSGGKVIVKIEDVSCA